MTAPQTDLNSLAEPIYAMLVDFPPDGKPHGKFDAVLITQAQSAGFIEYREQTKPCKTCGTPRDDYSYFRITDGGRLFMIAMDRARSQGGE